MNRTLPAFSSLALATGVLASVAGCQSPPSAVPSPSSSEPDSGRLAAVSTASIAEAGAPTVVTVLYRGHVPAEITKRADANKTLVTTILVGIEKTREGAWLRHVISSSDTKLDEIMRVPLGTNAPDPAPTERFSKSEKDLVRYAGVIESLGFLPRNDEYLAVSREHILHEDGDHLTLRDRSGKSPRRFGQIAQSAYKPALSPDGQTAAFWGCDGAIAQRGKTLPAIQACYATYIAPLKGRSVRIPELSESSSPVFDPDGRYVYATSLVRSKTDASKRDGGCFYRVDVAPPHARERLFCSSSDNDRLAFYLAPDGKTATVAATVRAPDLAQRLTWLALPDGRMLGSTTIPLASNMDGALGSNGLFVTSAGRGVVVGDATGRVRPVPGLERSFVSISPQWDGDSVYAIRRDNPDVVEVLRIDARAALGGAAPP